MNFDSGSLIQLYQQVVTVGLLQYLQQQHGMKVRSGIYCPQVVLWLMMVQRLQRGATLATTVQLLIQGAAGPLLQACHRIRQGRISSYTGGYCQARQKLPKLLCRQVSQEIAERLSGILGAAEGGPANVFVLDGSSLELEHCGELVRRYPPAQNQFGRSHWPVVKMVVAHDVRTGMAQTPCWGAMYGPGAVSEQELAENLIARLPAGSTVMGDRNFGVFWVAWVSQQRNLQVLLRLTDTRARKLAGEIREPGVYEVVWKASRWDGGKRHRFDDDATITGRLIAVRIGRGKSQDWLYLFTTTRLPMDEAVALYQLRWNIETDLRSLKRTVHLHHIYAKSEEMFEKELLMAVAAYNFVRAVMCMTARRNAIEPRQLSFSGVLNVVNCAWPKLVNARTKAAHDREFLRVLDLAAKCCLPKRSKRRSFPRSVWNHSQPFPTRLSEKTK
jgi:putative transposase